MFVSVVIPTFERPFLLKRLLHSIARQTWKEFEVIVVDDASTQEKEYRQIVEEYSSLIPSLSYCRNKQNGGPCVTRNKGIDLAKGTWIAFVDDDDEWKPAKLESQVLLAKQSDPSVGIVYTWCDAINENKVVWKYRDIPAKKVLPQLLQECFIPSPTVMVKKEALLVAGCFDQKMPSCEDWDMWTRICARGYAVACVQSVEAFYHKHTLPTVGTSPNAPLGYELFWKKHKELYRKYFPLLYLKRECKRLIKSGIAESLKGR